MNLNDLTIQIHGQYSKFLCDKCMPATSSVDIVQHAAEFDCDDRAQLSHTDQASNNSHRCEQKNMLLGRSEKNV